jgi:hypothetical protein
MLQRREVEEERKRRRADERMESEKRKGSQGYSRGTHVRGTHMQGHSRSWYWGTPGALESAVGAPPCSVAGQASPLRLKTRQ